jgi:hypothetical protein
MSDEALRDEIHKRFTLNWLIQGAAQHAGMTMHHLVRGELDTLDSSLVGLYDQLALINLLQYWSLEAVLLFGRPAAFWSRAATRRRHPFYGHPVLSGHGGRLAECSRRRALDRCREKGLWAIRHALSLKTPQVVAAINHRESGHVLKLMDLSRHAASMVWGISPDRLIAVITPYVAFGHLRDCPISRTVGV